MKFRSGIIYSLILVIVLAVAVGACSSATEEPTEEPPATEEQQAEATSAPAPTEAPAEPTATPAEAEEQITTTEPEPTEDMEAESTEPEHAEDMEAESTGEEMAEVMATTRNNLNLREGPGTGYAAVGNLAEDTAVTVIGKLEDDSWLMVSGDFGEAWVNGDPELIEVDSAQLAGVKVVDAPSLPYDISNPKVQQVLNQIPLIVHHDNNQTCASHGGLNNLLPEVVVGHVIGPHAGDFVLGSDNVLFKLTDSGPVLIRENPVARFEGGAESLPFATAMQMFANDEIIWTGEFGQPGRGIPGCDPAAG